MLKNILRVVEAVILSVCLLSLGFYMGSHPPSTNRPVCNITEQRPALAAVVDPHDGHLFAVPSLITVCKDANPQPRMHKQFK
jgi:hypothetical protein